MPRSRLPIGAIAADAYRAVWRERAALLLYAAVLLLAGEAVNLFAAAAEAMRLGVDRILARLGEFALAVLFISAWMRRLLLGHRLYQLDAAATWAVAWRVMLIGAIWIVPVVLTAATAFVVLLDPENVETVARRTMAIWMYWAAPLYFLALWIVATRASLIVPAAAIGRPIGLAAAWQATSGHGARLLAIQVIVALAPVAVIATAPFLLAGDGDSAVIAYQLVVGVAMIALAALIGAALADCHRRLCGPHT